MQIPFQLGHRGHRATPPTRAGTQSRHRLPSTHRVSHPARGGQVPAPSTPRSSQPCPRGTGPIVSSLLPPVHLSRPCEQNVWLPPRACGPGPRPCWPSRPGSAQLPAPGPQGCWQCPATHPRPQPSQPWGPGQSTLHPACSQHTHHPPASASFLPRGQSERVGRGAGGGHTEPWVAAPTSVHRPLPHSHPGRLCTPTCVCKPAHVYVCTRALGGRGPQLRDQGPPARPSQKASLCQSPGLGRQARRGC